MSSFSSTGNLISHLKGKLFRSGKLLGFQRIYCHFFAKLKILLSAVGVATTINNLSTTKVNPQNIPKRSTIMAEVTGLTNSEANELCKPADHSTKDFLFQQTMYRIKDPRKSLPFYTGVLGMTLLQKLDFPEAQFSLYFMGYENLDDIPSDNKQRTQWAMSRKATLELTHNWGTESDPDQKYHVGNSEPRGYGHIGLMVPDVYAACKRFEEQGVEFVKKPDDGRMKGLAFIKDPDGYWIEIFNANTVC